MISGIRNINFIQNIQLVNNKKVSFRGNGLPCDTFERSKPEKQDTNLSETMSHSDMYVDYVEKFKNTSEGIRRANLTDEELKNELTGYLNESFDRLHIKQELRPNIYFDKNFPMAGGYTPLNHAIVLNHGFYQNGLTETDMFMHEATHCSEAIKRAGIPGNIHDEIIKNELLSKIQNGENKLILGGDGLFGRYVIESPKNLKSIKDDFSKFADENLYVNSGKLIGLFRGIVYWEQVKQYSNPNIRPLIDQWMKLHFNEFPKEQQELINYFTDLSTKEYNELPDIAKSEEQKLFEDEIFIDFVDKIKTIVKNHPEFAKYNGGEEQAVKSLIEYSISHNSRYNTFSLNMVPYINVPELQGEELEAAKKSASDFFDTMDGNLCKESCSTSNLFDEAVQYTCSPEEVLANTNGFKFCIEKLQQKLDEGRKNGTLSKIDEEILCSKIKNAEKTIDFFAKGQLYLEKSKYARNNPEDENAAKEAEQLKKELMNY